jgi:dihydroorotate dehydrogenase|tara:strand:+ start:314 stop:1333 length:1020 start_codon:yes stop_codon:yes gene_type:complete
MFKLIRSILFLMPAETAHHFTLNTLKLLCAIPMVKPILSWINQANNDTKSKNVFGLNFKNVVGLAAGFDKNAKYIDELAALGFGFIEIGTVTPLPQEGNPLPRLFRLPKDEAIINRLGFNNDGLDAIVERLKKRRSTILIGGNIGKNKITPNKNAVDDYVICFNKLFDYVDYFVVNVSSPNTPNLRELQEKKQLFNLLNTLQELNNSRKAAKPILLKIAPDLNEHELKDILWVVKESGIAGIISSNTTIDRSNLRSNAQKVKEIGAGGLSGKPVLNKSNAVLHYLNKNKAANLPIIAVGGIHSASDAVGKLNAGADLVQLYTGFVYEGPQLIRSIRKAV